MILFSLLTIAALVLTYVSVFPKTKGVLRPLQVPADKKK